MIEIIVTGLIAAGLFAIAIVVVSKRLDRGATRLPRKRKDDEDFSGWIA